MTGVRIERHRDDDRNVTVRWNRTAKAEGYLLRFGSAPDALYQCIQVQGGSTEQLTMHALTRGQSYAWRVDAFNANGLTPGQCVLERQP